MFIGSSIFFIGFLRLEVEGENISLFGNFDIDFIMFSDFYWLMVYFLVDFYEVYLMMDMY